MDAVLDSLTQACRCHAPHVAGCPPEPSYRFHWIRLAAGWSLRRSLHDHLEGHRGHLVGLRRLWSRFLAHAKSRDQYPVRQIGHCTIHGWSVSVRWITMVQCWADLTAPNDPGGRVNAHPVARVDETSASLIIPGIRKTTFVTHAEHAQKYSLRTSQSYRRPLCVRAARRASKCTSFCSVAMSRQIK